MQAITDNVGYFGLLNYYKKITTYIATVTGIRVGSQVNVREKSGIFSA